MKKRLAICCALALSLLAGCAVTPPSDEVLQRDLADSIEETAEDWARDWEASFEDAARSWSTEDEDGAEKDHYWKVLDAEGSEAGTVTDPEQVKAIDALLSDDGHQGDRLAEDPGDPACSYVYCQQETLKAGQKAEDREYRELVRFTVSASEDVVTLVILEDLPSLLHVDLGDLLFFTLIWRGARGGAGGTPHKFVHAKYPPAPAARGAAFLAIRNHVFPRSQCPGPPAGRRWPQSGGSSSRRRAYHPPECPGFSAAPGCWRRTPDSGKIPAPLDHS